MKYKVVTAFMDLQDNNYIYNKGDTYPRDGMDPSEKRIVELSGTQNKRGIPLIIELKDKKEPTAVEVSPKKKDTSKKEAIKES